MTITTEDVNRLVWRYIVESGYNHAAFVFQNECFLDPSDSSINQIPPGSLFQILQKANSYMQLELRIEEIRSNPDDPLHNKLNELEQMFSNQSDNSCSSKDFQNINQSIQQLVHMKTASNADPIVHIVTPNPTNIPTAIIHHMDTKTTSDFLSNANHQLPSNTQFSKETNHFSTLHPLILSSSLPNSISHSVSSVKWSPDSTKLVSAFTDSTLIIWNIDQAINSSHVVIQVQNGVNDLLSLEWSCDSHFLAVGSTDSKIRLYDQYGNLSSILVGHTKQITGAKFSPNATLLASYSADSYIKLWIVNSNTMMQSFNHHKGSILDLSWRDNSTFAAASQDHNISICHVNGFFIPLSGHTDAVNTVDWSSDQMYLASGSNDHTIRIWNVQDIQLNVPETKHQTERLITSITMDDAVEQVKWIPGKNLLIAQSANGVMTILFFKAQIPVGISIIAKIYGSINNSCFDLSPDGNFVSFASGNQISLTKLDNSQKISQFEVQYVVSALKWGPSGKYIAVAFNDSTTAIINASDLCK